MDSKEYELEYFKTNKFLRKKCPSCGRYFWTQDTNKKICGEPPCGEYTFIGNSPMNKSMNLHEMRNFYLKFFEENGHTIVNRYPITARWRDDVFFTQASIYDFQPHVLNGSVEPPANPLTISQPCVRFNDIDNVGKTGRHFTMFEMMAHHAFNKKDNFVYFKDKTVELCNTLLTQKLGIKPEHISYVEEEWSGGGNAGPCFEVIVDGIELATLVFMMYKENDGKMELMDMQVVDTGYGLERFVWMSQGKENAYESVFDLKFLKDKFNIKENNETKKILGEYSKVAGFFNVESKKDLKEIRKEVAKKIGIEIEELKKIVLPYENIYTIADHSRALMFLLNDGVVPSNTKSGYFARLLIRRIIRSLREINKFFNLNNTIKISEIVEWQINNFKDDFKELEDNKEEILKICDIEEERDKKTLNEGKNIVARIAKNKKDKILDLDDLITLYDSHGLTPEIVKEFGNELNLKVDIPDDFYIKVANRHEICEKENKEKIMIKEIKEVDKFKTEKGYYENPKIYEFNAKIEKILDNYLVFDKTYFYPEGGGQECDTGTIEKEGKKINVVDVIKYNNVILHKIDQNINIKEGDIVKCTINKERRLQLTAHHTATHIINGCARNLFGNHIWQAGAHKSENFGRLDITHYSLLSDEELSNLENLGNKIVSEGHEIEISFLERNEAEKRFGFRLYQGGAVPGKFIRVVNIKNDGQSFDAEACGGMHFNNTRDVGLIKIIGQKRIQDGILRLEFVAGKRAIEFIKEEEKILKSSAKVFSVQPEILKKTCERFFKEWKELKKENEKIKNYLKKILKENLKGKENFALETFLETNDIFELINFGKLKNFMFVNFDKNFIITDKHIEFKEIFRKNKVIVYKFETSEKEKVKEVMKNFKLENLF